MAKRVPGIARLKLFLISRIGEVVTGQELYAASGLVTYQRRIRELRRAGWPIETENDDSELRGGRYRLTAQPPENAPTFSKRVSPKQRARILQRNGSICRLCGHAGGDTFEDGVRVRLHVDHIKQQEDGGGNEDENLRTLCQRCNEGGNRVLNPPSESLVRLKGLVRNTSETNQQDIYEFLKRRFGDAPT
ncbi:MAG: HNH endonuclease signature motif containing protein [Candidatus Tectomicrobia bacterium]|nr:HNH endonuclease signature motif containing protein [Candidatus Tectomicrobia bacterium]